MLSNDAVAIVTGGSAGLGRALISALARQGWRVITDARDGSRLAHTVAELTAEAGRDLPITGIPGNVIDANHRRELVAAAATQGPLRLLVNNASVLGPSPQPQLADLSLAAMRRIYDVNVFGPLALCQLALPLLENAFEPTVMNLSSDAGVDHYPGWGGYGSSKAALDHLTATLAAEQNQIGWSPNIAWYAVDPGDMATNLHQQAFPGEDISDRPGPETVVSPLLSLLRQRPASGRYRAVEFGSATR
jgi:NAD(P)-dependent dehydrogenase (short-subunit alcohol dehydrogenase family)